MREVIYTRMKARRQNDLKNQRPSPITYSNKHGAERICVLVLGATIFLSLLTGCQSSTISKLPASNRLSPAIRIPENVLRLGVIYPLTQDHELLTAYSRLEEATFQMKRERPLLQIVDCTDRYILLQEQRMQLSGHISDETASHVGGLLGVDSILLYKIMVPSSRERLVARFYEKPIELAVASKIIRVTTGEVIFYNVVTVRQEASWLEESFLASSLLPLLDEGITQTVADLQWAFH